MSSIQKGESQVLLVRFYTYNLLLAKRLLLAMYLKQVIITLKFKRLLLFLFAEFMLQDKSGFVRKRLVRKILRFRNFKRASDPLNYFREQLMLFAPWRNEKNRSC